VSEGPLRQEYPGLGPGFKIKEPPPRIVRLHLNDIERLNRRVNKLRDELAEAEVELATRIHLAMRMGVKVRRIGPLITSIRHPGGITTNMIHKLLQHSAMDHPKSEAVSKAHQTRGWRTPNKHGRG
jgi:hypothetical protein